MKDVIVLGGTGFIGRALGRRLKAQARSVSAVGSGDFDLSNAASTEAWFRKHMEGGREISHIFHLAAVYKAGGWPAAHPGTQFQINMALNLNALAAWKQFAPGARFTSVLSYCMYPDHDRPHPESELYGTEPESYLFAYAFTKKALLVGQRAYVQEFGLSAVSAVLPTVYGPGDSFLENSHVMGALIGKFSRAARENHPEVEVWGDGSQEREFLFVEDAVEGIVQVAARAKSDALNLGCGRAHTVAELAERIAGITGFHGRIIYNPDRFVGARRRLLDVGLAEREIGWKTAVALPEGIQATVRALR
jgi:GDP-L-fucose synthase